MHSHAQYICYMCSIIIIIFIIVIIIIIITIYICNELHTNAHTQLCV